MAKVCEIDEKWLQSQIGRFEGGHIPSKYGFNFHERVAQTPEYGYGRVIFRVNPLEKVTLQAGVPWGIPGSTLVDVAKTVEYRTPGKGAKWLPHPVVGRYVNSKNNSPFSTFIFLHDGSFYDSEKFDKVLVEDARRKGLLVGDIGAGYYK